MSPPAPRPERLALIIGAMKSGTTSLFEYLAEHPAVAASDPKEPAYFTGAPHDWDAARDGVRDDAWYFARWRWDAARHQIALEGSTDYTKLPFKSGAPDAALRFAREHAVDVRCIYLMRHPLERMESHFRHIAQFDPQRLFVRRAQCYEQAIAVSSYATQLRPWVATFGRERVMLLSFDELRTATDAVVRRVCRFLGIDDQVPLGGLDEARHVSDRRDAGLNALTRMRVVGRIWQILPSGLRARVKTLVDRLGERRRPYLTAGERRTAALRLRPEMSALAREHDFDVSRWRLDS